MLNMSERAAPIADRIDALLPQTQCTRCGFPTCRAYADAIATGDADIDRCPPGGADGVAALAHLLGVVTKSLDPAYGIEAPPIVAVIDEDVCIGCTKCIQACPVDAIVGAGKRMHTVIASECTGCELCLPPCPVDCIELVAPARSDAIERRAKPRLPSTLVAR
jgi:electron transport complex protein RnfB